MQELLKVSAESLLELFGRQAVLISPEDGTEKSAVVSPFFRTSRKAGGKKSDVVSETGDLLIRGDFSLCDLVPGRTRIRIGEEMWELSCLSRIGAEDGTPSLFELEIRR